MSAISMNKVNFTNGSGEPINDTNLNAIQTNAETAINEVQTNLESAVSTINGKIENITRYYTGWASSSTFYVPIGHQAIVLVSNNALYLVWNPSDNLQWGAIYGSGITFTRDSSDTTQITASKSGNSTWSILVL